MDTLSNGQIEFYVMCYFFVRKKNFFICETGRYIYLYKNIYTQPIGQVGRVFANSPSD